MAVPILFLYIVGIILFIFGLENEKEGKTANNIIYLGLAWFVNLMGYYLSYSDTDYTLMAYFPLMLLILTTLILIYTAYGLINLDSWDNDADSEND